MEPRFTVHAGHPAPPIPFEVAGIDRKGVAWVEPFTALPTMTIGSTLALGDTLNVTQLVEFLRLALVPEDRDRFSALLDNPDRLVEATTLWDLLSHLTDVMMGRPISPSPGSPNGAGATGPTSPDGSSSPDMIPMLSTAGPSST